MKKLTPFLFAGLLLAGCGQRSMVGTWKCASTGGSYILMTLNADHTAKTETVWNLQRTTLNLHGVGTWSATDNEFTFTEDDVRVDGEAASDKAATEKAVLGQKGVKQVCPYRWTGSQAFTLVRKGGEQEFVRQDPG